MRFGESLINFSSVKHTALGKFQPVFIFAHHYYESAGEEAFAQQPIGCGPYQFVSHNEGDKVVLQAYENYYMGAAAIKNVTFKIISDMSSMSIGLQSGGIDFAEVEAPVRSTLESADGVTVTTAEQTTLVAFIQRLNSPFSVRIPFFSIARTVAPSWIVGSKSTP